MFQRKRKNSNNKIDFTVFWNVFFFQKFKIFHGHLKKHNSNANRAIYEQKILYQTDSPMKLTKSP